MKKAQKPRTQWVHTLNENHTRSHIKMYIITMKLPIFTRCTKTSADMNFSSQRVKRLCMCSLCECATLCAVCCTCGFTRASEHDRWFTVKCFYFMPSLKFNLSASSFSRHKASIHSFVSIFSSAARLIVNTTAIRAIMSLVRTTFWIHSKCFVSCIYSFSCSGW